VLFSSSLCSSEVSVKRPHCLEPGLAIHRERGFDVVRLANAVASDNSNPGTTKLRPSLDEMLSQGPPEQARLGYTLG